MGFAPPFDVRIDARDGIASIALSGELDMATVPLLEGHLARLDGVEVTDIRLDIRDLAFLDSSGLHALIAARDLADTNGQHLSFVGASGRARRLFELTGTRGVLADPTPSR